MLKKINMRSHFPAAGAECEINCRGWPRIECHTRYIYIIYHIWAATLLQWKLKVRWSWIGFLHHIDVCTQVEVQLEVKSGIIVPSLWIDYLTLFYSTFHSQSKCSEAKLGRACLLKSIKSDGTTWLDCAHQQSLNWIVNWTTVSTPILSPNLKMQVLLPTFIFATLVLLTKDAGAAKGGVRGAGVLRCKGVFLSYF